MAYLAVDLGGSHVSCALVEQDQMLCHGELPIEDKRRLSAVLPAIAELLTDLRRSSGRPVEGLGFGFCGVIDEKNNRIASTNDKYADAADLDLIEWAQRCLGVPLRLGNDARLALRGEMAWGAARDHRNVVMLTLGTGIGGVAAIDGKLLRGAHGFAGSLGGHIPIALGGRPCTCGSVGCAEAEASGWALPELCREQPHFASSRLATKELNFQNLFELAAAGDAVAVHVRDHCLHVWGAATAAAVVNFDPSLVVLGGGVLKSHAAILPSIREHVRRNAWTPCGPPEIVVAQLGNRAALFGVEALFEENY